MHRPEGGRHLAVQLDQHLFAGPVVVHVALHLLEVAAGDSARVREQVRDHEHAALVEHAVRFRRGRPVGPLRDDLHARRDPLHRLLVDLVLEGGRDQDVHVLRDPVLPGEHLVAQCARLVHVDAAELVGDLLQRLQEHAGRAAERVALLVALVPARHAGHLAAHLDEHLDRVLRDVAESLHRRRRLRRLQPELVQRLPDRVDHPVPGGLLAPQRPAHAHRLAGDEPGQLHAVQRLQLVQHPQHVLRRRHHVRRRHVPQRPDIRGHLPHPAPAQVLLLPHRQVVRIADDAALGAAQRDVHHRALPRHPHRQRPHRIERLVRMEADPALARSARVVVLYPEPAEDLVAAIIHAHRDRERVLPLRVAEQVAGRRVQLQQTRDPVELRLRHLERVEFLRQCGAHVSRPRPRLSWFRVACPPPPRP